MKQRASDYEAMKKLDQRRKTGRSVSSVPADDLSERVLTLLGKKRNPLKTDETGTGHVRSDSKEERKGKDI